MNHIPEMQIKNIPQKIYFSGICSFLLLPSIIWSQNLSVQVISVERQPVASCNLKTVGYDNNLKNLEIEFHSGMIYQYQNVPTHIYENLLSAPSTGTFFTDKIKNRYRSVRLDKVNAR